MSTLAVAVMIGTCVIVWGGLAVFLLRARRQEAAKGTKH